MQEYYALIGENKSPYSIQGSISGVEDLGGIAGGGRISRDFQITPEMALQLGLSGGGMISGRSDVPSQFKATGFDANVQMGDQGFGVNYNRPNAGSPGMPTWMLNYFRSF